MQAQEQMQPEQKLRLELELRLVLPELMVDESWTCDSRAGYRDSVVHARCGSCDVHARC